MQKQHLSYHLPKKLAKEWCIKQTLSYDHAHIVYVIQNQEDPAKEKVLKIYRHHTFSYQKYRHQKHFSKKHLLLPEKHMFDGKNDYLFYAKEDRLSDLIHTSGISFQEIISMGIDLTDAVMYLMQNGCYEADISPLNIYRKIDGSFCLGDIGFDRQRPLGTSPYIPPECLEHVPKSFLPKDTPIIALSKRARQKRFDKAMQYAVCKLLSVLIQLQKSFAVEDALALIQTGTHPQPQHRFSSLQTLRNALADLLKNHTEKPDTLLLSNEEVVAIFQKKTLPMSSYDKNRSDLISAVLLVAAGMILCINVIHYFEAGHPPDPQITDARILTSAHTPETASPVVTAHSMSPASVSSDTKTPVFMSAVAASASAATCSAVPSILPHKTPDRELDIQNRKLTSLEKTIKTTKNKSGYFYLYAGGNRFQDVRHIDRFPSLKEVYLNNNHIQKISGISSLCDLEILVLSYNDVKEISSLKHLRHIKYLDLSSNPHFQDVQSLKTMRHLQILNISNTKISGQQFKQLQNALPHCQIIG